MLCSSLFALLLRYVWLANMSLEKLINRGKDYQTSTICGSLSCAAPKMLCEKQNGIEFHMRTLGVFTYQVLISYMTFET